MSTSDIINDIKAKESVPQYWDFKENDKREHVHSMIRYPAVMVPNMQGEIFDIILKNDDSISNVLDPFMGSGTILVEGLLRGLDVYGIDINPLSYLAVAVKLYKYNNQKLKEKAISLITQIKDSKIRCKNYDFDNIDKWYTKDVIKQLSKIRFCILKETDLKYRQFFWLTFAEITKQADNSRTSTFKLHIKEKEIIDNWHYNCIDAFSDKLFENINAVEEFANKTRTNHINKKISIKYGDSLKILSDRRIIRDNSIDLIITSPPYGDNATTITYGQFSVLSLKWIPISDINNDLDEESIKTLSKIDSDSLGGHKYTDNSIVSSTVFKYSESFSNVYKELCKDNKKDKARKVASFFIDIERIIILLHRVVKPNKYMVFTVGNRHVNKKEVPFDEILSSIAENYGFKVIYDFRRNIIKNKNYTDSKAQNYKTIKKETIIVLQKKS